MVWAVDRLGRSLPDLVGSMQELRGAKVDLFIHQQGLDTTTPAGRAMFGMLGVFSEFERAMIVARVSAGLARAKVHGTKSGKAIGRPRITAKVEQRIREELAACHGILKVASIALALVADLCRALLKRGCGGYQTCHPDAHPRLSGRSRGVPAERARDRSRASAPSASG